MFGFFKKNKAKHKPAPEVPAPLVEGEDFYVENGLYIFTAAYHRKRGYCCGNGCLHCPYGKK